MKLKDDDITWIDEAIFLAVVAIVMFLIVNFI
jgi:hypothetical protein